MQYGKPSRVWLSLGSNIGDRKQMLASALESLSLESDVSLEQVSSLYETAPWGNTDQSSFYNLAVEIGTALEPLELLNTAKLIEHRLGREPGPHWGPRVIDIDIVLWESSILDTPELSIPHPRFRERAFVLFPLSEIAPTITDPVTGLCVRDLLVALEDISDVKRIDAELEFPDG